MVGFLTDHRISARNLSVLVQSGSLVQFLIDERDRRALLAFVSEAMQRGGWDAAVQKHYRYRSIDDLEQHGCGV
jgi:hypothetical protein